MLSKNTVLAALACVGAASINHARAQSTFVDGFESSSLSPFWSPFTNAGSVTPASTAEVHTGGHALQLNTSGGAGGSKAAGIQHVFAQPTYGILSVWLYDTGANIASSNYLTLLAPPFALGTFDYDLSPTNGGSYVYGAGTQNGHSTVDRTQGWHHFVITSTSSSYSLTIDGTSILTGSGGLPFTQVQLEMHAPSWRPDWVCYFDDFQWTSFSGVTYCATSTTTNGCTPDIASEGVASATALTGFTLSCADVEGNRSAMFFYGMTQAAVPWGPGSTSTLCIAAPTQRTNILGSGGTNNSCTGALSLDWNAWRAGSSAALGSPFTAGQAFHAQAWFRDPLAPKGTNLSDAVTFTLDP